MNLILGPLSKSLARAFLVSMSLSIGLEITWREVVGLLRDEGLLLRALVANIVLVPLLGVILVCIFPMPRDFEIAFLLLAAAPGAPSAIRYTRNEREDAPFAAGLAMLLICAAIILTPFLAKIILPLETRVTIPYDQIATVLVLYIIFPSAIGVTLQCWPEESDMIGRVSLMSARLFFAAWMIITFFEQSKATSRMGVRTLAAMFCLIAGSMILGWVMGGPKREKRRILASTTSMRNVALCAAIALRSFPGTDVDIALVAFSSMMATPASILVFYENFKKRWGKGRAASLRRSSSF
jgi:bile acid:Na+ symporter, BASS family